MCIRDRFITEQMAGDLIPDRNFFTQVATGFNRNHRINSEGGSIPDEWIVEYVADRVETMGTMFLGLTLTCSRCHDHKYDPIKQKDFYRLFAFFNNIAEAGLGPNNGNSPPFITVPKSWPELTDDEAKFVVPAPVKIKVVQTSVPRPQSGKPDTVMVLHELTKPRDTYRLERGMYDQPDKSEQLYPATPPMIAVAWACVFSASQVSDQSSWNEVFAGQAFEEIAEFMAAGFVVLTVLSYPSDDGMATAVDGDGNVDRDDDTNAKNGQPAEKASAA